MISLLLLPIRSFNHCSLRHESDAVYHYNVASQRFALHIQMGVFRTRAARESEGTGCLDSSLGELSLVSASSAVHSEAISQVVLLHFHSSKFFVISTVVVLYLLWQEQVFILFSFIEFKTSLYMIKNRANVRVHHIY